MKARAHVLIGLSAGLAVVEVAARIGVGLGPVAAGVFVAVSAGGALLPDLDTPVSTAARAGGYLGQWVAGRIGDLSERVYRNTATAGDDVRRGGHRTLTHTAAAAAVAGVTVGLVVSVLGLLPTVGAVVAMIALARRGALGRPRRFGCWRLLAPLVLVAGVWWWAGEVLMPSQGGAVVVGVAVTTGMLAHNLADLVTDSGVPLLWPVRVRGRRWFRLRLPARWALRTGGPEETLVVVAVLILLVMQFGMATAFEI